MKLIDLHKRYPAAEITATRVAAYYREGDVSLSVLCEINPATGFAAEGAIQGSIDDLAAKIAKLKA